MPVWLLALIALTADPAAPQDATPAWPGFRGQGNSLTELVDLPLKWSDDENVAWSVELPGYGQSSPVVFGQRVYTTSIEGKNKETLIVSSFDVKTGEKAWSKTFPSSAPIADSDYVSRAAPTPVVDAAGVYAFFESGDLIALNPAGEVRWQRSLVKEYGEIRGAHGLGGSLAQTAGEVLVLAAHEGPSYLLSVRKTDGKNHWKLDRDPGVAWTSPVVFRRGDRDVVLISGSGRAAAFDAADHRELWSFGGLEGNTVPSPTPWGDWIVFGSSDAGSNIAVRWKSTAAAADPLSPPPPAAEIAWRSESASSSFGSPLIHAGHVYFVNRAGVAHCLSLDTGASLWTHRLPGPCWASPLGSGDRVYFFGREGQTTVVSTAPTFTLLSTNTLTLPGRLYGLSPLPSSLLLRTGTRLVRVGK